MRLESHLRSATMAVVFLASSLWLAAPRAASACAGDCDSGGSVSIAELVRAVNIALGNSAISLCSAADRNGDDRVTINELISAVNSALSGCPLSTPVPTSTPSDAATATETPSGPPTSTAVATGQPTVTPTAGATVGATATSTPGAPLGIFIHPNSVFQHVSAGSDFISVTVMVAVDRVAEATLQVSLTGPGGTTEIPFGNAVNLGGQMYAQHFVAGPQPALSYEAGEPYALSVVASTGTATLEFTAVGGIEIAADGSQVSWQFDGDSEQFLVISPAQTVGYSSGLSDRTSPFAIPVSAYGSGPATYRVQGEVRQTVRSFTGAAPGSSFLITESLYESVVPAAVGDTHTPTPTFTLTPTATRTPTRTATPTITGTIPPTPVVTGEILFDSTRNGGRHIFVMDADGTNVAQLTDAPGSDSDPDWNPDKSLVVFTRDARLHLMAADGSDVEPLRDSGFQLTPTFSPDGAAIVFGESIFPRTNLSVYRLADGEITQLTDGPWTDFHPTFSPDGQHIYFTSNRDSGLSEIYRMDADGSDVVRITENSDFEQLGEVSPDGTSLAFSARVSFGTRSLAVFVMDLSTFESVQLTSTQDNSDDESPLWSPDGAYLAYRPFIDSRAKVFRMQPNGLFMTDLSPMNASEVAGDWK